MMSTVLNIYRMNMRFVLQKVDDWVKIIRFHPTKFKNEENMSRLVS